MTDLRAALIEAGARAIHALDIQANGRNPWQWERATDQEWYLEEAESALDAALDTLADRADEWWVEAAEGRAVDCRVEHWVHEPEGLIAVLRGDTE